MCISSFKKLLNIIFKKDNVEYDLTMEKLNRIYKQVNKVSMEFPDIHSFDFQVLKNIWKELPEEAANGVDVMGLHIEDDYRSVICHYGIDSSINPHRHNKEWEIIQILEGWCIDQITKTKLVKGDIYIIPKGMEHHIVTLDEECYMYILFTEHSEHLVIPHTEPDLAKKFISKRQLTQPQKIDYYI